MPRSTPGAAREEGVVAVARGSAADSADGAPFQARVRIYLIVLLAITLGLHALVLTARVVFDDQPLGGALAAPDALRRLAMILAFGGGVALVSRRRLSRRALRGLDAGAAILFAVAGVLAPSARTPELRPDLLILLGVSLVLVARAGLVPSSALRTLAVGVLALAPLLAVAPLFYAPDHLVNDVPLRRIVRVTVLGFGASTLVVTCVISQIIYQLRRSLGRAMKLGPYELGRKIGEGGMGTVYEARHAALRRRTALKLIRPERLDPGRVEQFEREAQLTSELSHPNTVALYDYGQTPDGICYRSSWHRSPCTTAAPSAPPSTSTPSVPWGISC